MDLLTSLNADDISQMARLSTNGGGVDFKLGSAFSSKLSIISSSKTLGGTDHVKHPSLVNYDSNAR